MPRLEHLSAGLHQSSSLLVCVTATPCRCQFESLRARATVSPSLSRCTPGPLAPRSLDRWRLAHRPHLPVNRRAHHTPCSPATLPPPRFPSFRRHVTHATTHRSSGRSRRPPPFRPLGHLTHPCRDRFPHRLTVRIAPGSYAPPRDVPMASHTALTAHIISMARTPWCGALRPSVCRLRTQPGAIVRTPHTSTSVPDRLSSRVCPAAASMAFLCSNGVDHTRPG